MSEEVTQAIAETKKAAMDVKAATLSYIDGLKKAAQEAGDVEGVSTASRLRSLVETEGLKLVEKPARRVFLEQCLLGDPRPVTQEETRQKMRACNEQWDKLPEEEKKKYKDTYELRE